MRFTVVWIADKDDKKNAKTGECLKKELGTSSKAQVLLYGGSEKLLKDMESLGCVQAVEGADLENNCAVFRDAAERAEGEYVTVLEGGDTWSGGSLAHVDSTIKQFGAYKIFMMKKIMPDGERGALCASSAKSDVVLRLDENFGCQPFYFGGTFVEKALLRDGVFQPELGMEAERKLFLELIRKMDRAVYMPECIYNSASEREGDETFFKGLYEKDFYLRSFSQFWIPYLNELAEEGSIPMSIQYHFMFSVTKRFLANFNNQNKHVLSEEEARESFGLISEALKLLDDRAVFNAKKIGDIVVSDSMKWFIGVLKYGEDYHFERGYIAGESYYRAGYVMFNTVKNLKTNIQFMNARDGWMDIDGYIHPILFSMCDGIYFEYGDNRIEPVYNERYGLFKIMGVSVYKNHSFHISFRYREKIGSTLYCFAKFGSERVKILFGYESHFSRMGGRFDGQYWAFTDNDLYYMMTKSNDGLKISKSGRKMNFRQEKALYKEMFHAQEDRKRAWLFIAIRMAYHAFKPLIKRRPVWMYLDKIYKAGDSAEYLYRYACSQKDGTRHYYLVDKNSPDYKRLKRDGYKPLVRGSIKHRLIFLLADMMVISNSTVFTFNDFGMINSSYVRDLVDFHVCCVQHGMSVQQIGMAQNRLRDNTRLYFCASPYEIRNLSRPVYDYLGYGALKLTGVPRYDGLKSDDKKQILISPTWRMQAAVPVRGSEGHARDYNHLFKETTYFRIFNSLINDSRLIDAAKELGYKIVYVLHPIVSAQAKDFDKNDYVDIIPSTGEMSYEKLFRESSLMVTDFSGVQFDFAYMRKPVVYLHHRDVPQHYEEGTFLYDTMAFGEICHDNDELIDTLIDYMKNDCRMKDEYVARADDFFFYNDHNNCERIYNVMTDYQNHFIYPEREKEVSEAYIQEHPYASVPSEAIDLLESVDGDDKLQGEFSVSERQNIVSAYDELIEEAGLVPGKTTVADNYYDYEIEENTVLLLGLGHSVKGNLHYLLDELNHSPEFEGYRVFVRCWESTEEIAKRYIEDNKWDRTEIIVDGREYNRWLERAKYLITEVFFPEEWMKKPGQIVINTWHGTPLKKLGLAKNFKNLHKDGNTQRNFIDADYLLCPNDYTKEHLIASYKVEEILRGDALMLGYPRTGGMLAVTQEETERIRKELAPDAQKIYAYMPTWKDYLGEEKVIEETIDLLNYLDGALSDEQILYVNLHHKVDDRVDYSSYVHIKQFPPDLDSYKLLAATDALITDFSSVFYDYLASRKQIVLYCEDYERYRSKRGTYMDLMELPFDKAWKKEEIISALNRGKTYDDTEAFERFCSYDSRESAAELCSIVAGKPDPGLRIRNIDKSDRKKVMIYSERFQRGDSTTLIEKLAREYDKEKNQLYLSCQMFAVDNNKESAYPLLRDNPVIGTTADARLSARGKVLRKMVQEGTLDFDKAMEYLIYDYALITYREYGHAVFDTVLIYDVLDPDRLIALSLMHAERVLCISDENLNALRSGDEFTKKALLFAAARCNGIFTFGIAVEKELRMIFPDFPETTVLYDHRQLLRLFEGGEEQTADKAGAE